MSFDTRVSESIRLLQPYKAGLTVEAIQDKYQLSTVYKYASNESPFPPAPSALTAMQEAFLQANRYPDYQKLKQAIASNFDLNFDNVMTGTGSINVLDQLFQIFNLPGNNVVFSSHSYFGYPLLAQKSGMKVKIAQSGSHFEHIPENLVAQCDAQTSILVIDNPTNFSGTALDHKQLSWILDNVSKHTIVILDQAYAEFSDMKFVEIEERLFQHYPNLVVTRTFSKAYSLASLRVGYGLANPKLVSWFNRAQQPFPISNIANAAAIASLEDKEYATSTIQAIKEGRAWLNDQLQQMGITTSESHSNFVMGHFGTKAGGVYQDLLEKGFITRQMTIYKAPEYLRISVGTNEENQRLIKALAEHQGK